MRIYSHRRHFIGILLMLLAMTDFGSGVERRGRIKYTPLDWRWTAAEKQELRKMLPKVKSNPDGSFYLETNHWRVTTWHTPFFTVQAGAYMDKFTAVFSRVFVLKAADAFTDYKPELRIYNNRADYLKLGDAPEWSAGICASTADEIILHTYYDFSPNPKKKHLEPDFDQDAPLSTIQHEGTHAFLHLIGGEITVPLWLHEGLASYYEAWGLRNRLSPTGETNAETRDKRITYSQDPGVAQYYYDQHREADLPRLADLLAATTHELFYIDGGGELTVLNYALAESFIDFLMTDKKRRQFLGEMLQRLRGGVKPLVTDAEVLNYEMEWLTFLRSHWGVHFDNAKFKQRSSENSRAQAAMRADAKKQK